MKTKKEKLSAVRYTLYAILAGCLLVGGLACESEDNAEAKLQQEEQDRLEKITLEAQLAQLQEKNEQLQNQIKHLLDLGPEAKLKFLATVDKISITKRSGLYDKDRDGRKEKLIVYVRPIDADGDYVKVPGAVRLLLLDLNAKGEEMLLQERFFSPDELKKLWVSTFMTGYYRLTLDVNEEITKKKELTVKADFSDYLTGKVHSAQKVILPR